MPLILAIEPDRRQAAQLTAVIRRRLNAELLLAATTEQALEAIGSRVPDLVLVPALLSPQDDTALAGALRMIATAAHVQMLTIPVLASRTSAEGSRSVFGLLRRGRDNSAHEGCDPNVFAEQIASYLRQSAEERAAVVEQDVDDEVHDVPAAPINFGAPQPVSEPEPYVEPALAAPATEQAWQPPLEPEPSSEVVAERTPIYEPPAELEPAWQPSVSEPSWQTAELPETIQASTELEPALVWEPSSIEVVGTGEDDEASEAQAWMTTDDGETAVIEEERDPNEIDLGAELEIDEELDFDSFVAREFGDDEPYELTMFSDDEPGLESIEPELLDPADEFVAYSRAPEIDESDLWAPLGAVAQWPQFPTDRTVVELSAAVDDETDISAFAVRPSPVFAPVVKSVPATKPVPAPSTGTATPEWVALIESLRHDIERLRKEPTAPAPMPTTTAPPPKRRQQVRPAQDEWGFFDPEQCGFTALLAKLDEVTKESDDVPAA